MDAWIKEAAVAAAILVVALVLLAPQCGVLWGIAADQRMVGVGLARRGPIPVNKTTSFLAS